MRDTSRFVAYQFHPLTFSADRYSRCKFLKDEAVHPEKGMTTWTNLAKRRNVRRGTEKYTEEELAALDSKDRKRLKLREPEILSRMRKRKPKSKVLAVGPPQRHGSERRLRMSVRRKTH